MNGKPIYYWVNQQDKTVPYNAGYVALINCTNIKVQNLKLVNNGQGILLVSTKDSMITNNIVENNAYGIYIFNSPNINVTGNKAVSNRNTICYNYIWGNAYAGINLVDSDENQIIGNTLMENNGWGFTLIWC
ncbi:MAG: NosD domain-containing protein [Candidatus Bathyarchaeia archaeon]